jgi:hypothetical protein
MRRIGLMGIHRSLFLLVLFFVEAAMAQQRTISVSGDSTPDCPVVVYGTMTAVDDPSGASHYTYKAHLSITNVSGKDILLLITKLEAKDVIRFSLDDIEVTDDFFNEDMFASGATRVLETTVSPYGEPTGAILPAALPPNASASAYPIFVQFADGSTWGDSEMAAPFLRLRDVAWKRIEKLAQSYWFGGEKLLMTEIMRPGTEPLYVSDLRLLYKNKDDIGEIIHTLLGKLKAGDFHQASLHKSAGLSW